MELVNFMPQLLCTCEMAMLTIELGGWVGPKSWSECFEKKKNLLSLLGFKPQIIQPIT